MDPQRSWRSALLRGFGIRTAPVIDAVNRSVFHIHKNGMAVALAFRNTDLVSHAFECLQIRSGNSLAFDGNNIRQPLMMEARGIHGLAAVHAEFENVQYDAQNSVDDGAAAR